MKFFAVQVMQQSQVRKVHLFIISPRGNLQHPPAEIQRQRVTSILDEQINSQLQQLWIVTLLQIL
jgi:hypothetical protein